MPEDAVALTLIPEPVPEQIWEGPAATAWYWPDATPAMRGHTAHYLLTLVSEDRDRIATSLRLTQLAAAVATVARPIALLWGPAGRIHQAAAFLEQAKDLSRDLLPLHLWLDFRVEPRGSGLSWLFTTGMRRLGQPEIEIMPTAKPPQQLLEAAYNTAHFLLDNKEPIQEGTTLGLPDGTQAAVNRAPSLVASELDVFQMTLE